MSGPAPEHLVVAVVGCGRWGRNVVRDLIADGCAVIAVDPSATARDTAIDLGATVAVSDLASLPFRVHGVVVSGPTRLHADLAHDALGLGVPVFVEKPMTDDVSTARALVEHGGDRLFVMHKWSYHPGIEALADLASTGELGDVEQLESFRRGAVLPSEDTDVLWLLGPHEITIGAAILGSFPVHVEASAEVVDRRLRRVDVSSVGVDGRPHRWLISVDPGSVRRKVVIRGSRSVAVLNSAEAPHIEVVDVDGKRSRRVAVAAESPLVRELRAFTDHLRGGPPPPTTGPHGLAVVEVLARIRAEAGLPPRSLAGLSPRDDASVYGHAP